MTVYPLSLGGVTRPPEHLKDGTTRHPSVSVLSQGGIEPTDASGASDGIQAQGPDTAGVVAVDRVTHWSFAVVVILQGRPAQSRSEMCHLAN